MLDNSRTERGLDELNLQLQLDTEPVDPPDNLRKKIMKNIAERKPIRIKARNY